MKGTDTMSAIQECVANLVTAARVAVELGGMSADDALSLAARGAVSEAHAAATRGGRWAVESTTEQIDATLFQGSVARDILDGTVSRPSTGNVRAYALALLTR
jgi:hypothetical protein